MAFKSSCGRAVPLIFYASSPRNLNATSFDVAFFDLGNVDHGASTSLEIKPINEEISRRLARKIRQVFRLGDSSQC